MGSRKAESGWQEFAQASQPPAVGEPNGSHMRGQVGKEDGAPILQSAAGQGPGRGSWGS